MTPIQHQAERVLNSAQSPRSRFGESERYALTWALAISTYNRRPALEQCIRCALAQTRPPSEIIIVDGSSNWQSNRDQIASLINTHDPLVPLQYIAADQLSLPAQRNQAIRAATADILFLIDDDSFLYPDCAQIIMEAYERDIHGTVAALCARAREFPPGNSTSESPPSPHPRSNHSYLQRTKEMMKRMIGGLLRSRESFIPYDFDHPRIPLPLALNNMNVEPILIMPGYALTVRRTYALREPFESRMLRYASGEDCDATYRLSRHGALGKVLNALLYHADAQSGRLPSFTVTALGVINPLFMHRLHSSDRLLSRRRSISMLRRRLIIQLIKDLTERRFSFPTARGVLYGLLRVNRIFRVPDPEFDALFDSIQRKLLGTEFQDTRGPDHSN